MSWNWTSPPGDSRNPRATVRKLVISFLVGILSLGVAWAGTGLVPVNDLAQGTQRSGQNDSSFVGLEEDGAAEATAEGELEPLEAGQIYAGAAKVSLYPRPEDYQGQFPGATWEKDPAKCKTLEPSQDAFEQTATHVADFRVRWAENPNCLYMGGYGLGPMNPITSWDLAKEDDQDTTDDQVPDGYGLWSRSVAMSDGTDAVVLTLIDAVYWEAHYNTLCPGEPATPADRGDQNCGFLDLAQTLSQETGLDAKSFVFASTHSHTAMDFIGGWGAVPEWYMQQATDSLKASVLQSLESLQPAVLEAGEDIVRDRNAERRDFYRSAEENTVSWFKLVDADDQPQPEVCTTPEPSPTPWLPPGRAKKATPAPAPSPICEPASPGRAIATVGSYAAHPVTEDESGGEADADFPAVFAKNVEDRFGGIGMFLQTGLGNVSPRGDKFEMGNGIASHIPAIGGGDQIVDTNVRVGRTPWVQPVTNSALAGLGVGGFFDRTMNQTPATISVGKGQDNKKCKSASPVSVETSVSAVKVGSLWITGGPGELFSNLSNAIEERNPNGVTLALGLVNDGLGYIIQSFETDHAGRQALGFAGKAETPDEWNDNGGPPVNVGLAEYEDAYSIDHCFGDATLEYTIQLLGSL